ncbi:hypothetical protein [uncultured Shewanella sp.]|uniref:hypothetical protein n=1 Tax=uncultured Shewanella sp. TaxID=173975 RepID=UPI002612DA81|nr:hypothetical protein [uncultured Shewanella sp.]
MTKFHRAYFLSFSGETEIDGSKGYKKSFFHQGKHLDPSLDQTTRQYQMRLYNQEYKTRDYIPLISNSIPFIRINFPCVSDNTLKKVAKQCTTNYPNLSIEPSNLFQCLRVSKNNNEDNISVALRIMKEALNEAGPFTRLYILAHGIEEEDYLLQKIYYPYEKKNLEINTGIRSYLLAELITEAIPKVARNDFQVKLLACHPIFFAQKLMENLNEFNFKKSSVIAYNERLITYTKSKQNYRRNSIDNSFFIDDTFGESKKKFANNKDNKIVFHNYEDGIVQYLPSKEFTDRYQRVFEQNYVFKPDHNDSNPILLTKMQKEVLMLRNNLINSLDAYLTSYQQRKEDFIHGAHGESGYLRVQTFIGELLKIHTQHIINSDNTDYLINSIIVQINAFAQQIGVYSKFKGTFGFSGIKVKNKSAMTYIFKALETFFLSFQPIQSKTLIKFACTISRKKISALQIETGLHFSDDFFLFSDEENRKKALSILKTNK